VKFPVDNQLPAALAEYLRRRGFDCQHVLEVGLGDALDSEICQYAENQGHIIVSEDEISLGPGLIARASRTVFFAGRMLDRYGLR
jgi:uncharacterized protein with PIN domain